MVISVVEVLRISFSVVAATKPSMVVGDEGTNGGLWCSPVAKTSSPTSSAFWAIRTMALIRSRSVGSWPVVGSGVTSPTVKTPNCITNSLLSWMSPVLGTSSRIDRCLSNYLPPRVIPAARPARAGRVATPVG